MKAKVIETGEIIDVQCLYSIWHDVSEKPELERPLLIKMKGIFTDFRRQWRVGCCRKRDNGISDWLIDMVYTDGFIDKWCYIDDIFRLTEIE